MRIVLRVTAAYYYLGALQGRGEEARVRSATAISFFLVSVQLLTLACSSCEKRQGSVLSARTEQQPATVTPVTQPEVASNLSETEATRQAEELFTRICLDVSTQTVDGRVVLRCKCPPAYVSDDYRELRGHVFGRFTSPYRLSAVIAISGCEPHALQYGGSAFFTHTRGDWAFEGYIRGLITKSCYKADLPNKQQILICTDVFMAQGIDTTWIYALAFQANGSVSARVIDIFDFTDDTAAGRRPMTKASLLGVVVADVNGDGFPDVTVRFEHGRWKGIEDDPETLPAREAIPCQEYKVRFLYHHGRDSEPSSFIPEPPAVQVLAALDLSGRAVADTRTHVFDGASWRGMRSLQ